METRNFSNMRLPLKFRSEFIHFLTPKLHSLLDGPSKLALECCFALLFLGCLAMLTVCFKATLLSSHNSQSGNGAHVREKAAPAHLGAPRLFSSAFLLSFQLKISHQLPMRLPVFSTDYYCCSECFTSVPKLPNQCFKTKTMNY